MSNEEFSEQDVNVLSEGGESEGRQRSTIGFPYADLSDAENVAMTIYNNAAFGTCTDDQLAPWLGMSAKSSGYRVRLGAARMFGVIQSESGRHSLSFLGKEIVDPIRQRQARVNAFLAVPLFAKVFTEYKGAQLPPPAALERSLEGMGVAPKQRTRARQILERSAEQAGFFELGKGRLVRPANTMPLEDVATDALAEVQQEAEAEDKAGGGGGGKPPLDGMIIGLIDKLPRGTADWKLEDRITWLKAATVIFQLVYGSEKEIDIHVKGTRLHFPGGQAGKSSTAEHSPSADELVVDQGP